MGINNPQRGERLSAGQRVSRLSIQSLHRSKARAGSLSGPRKARGELQAQARAGDAKSMPRQEAEKRRARAAKALQRAKAPLTILNGTALEAEEMDVNFAGARMPRRW